MAITFHCEYCGKKIEAPDSAGGKWGKCPVCHHKLYVPKLDSDEELKLAPLDETEEERRKRLIAETHKLTQDILQEKVVPEVPAEVADGPAEVPEVPAEVAEPIPIYEMGEKELTKNVILYLRQMADGELDQAQRVADSITPYGRQAVEILDRIALSEIPEPELADVPQQVLSGLIRDLRARIS